jgi:hypothetical protein
VSGDEDAASAIGIAKAPHGQTFQCALPVAQSSLRYCVS